MIIFFLLPKVCGMILRSISYYSPIYPRADFGRFLYIPSLTPRAGHIGEGIFYFVILVLVFRLLFSLVSRLLLYSLFSLRHLCQPFDFFVVHLFVSVSIFFPFPYFSAFFNFCWGGSSITSYPCWFCSVGRLR